MVYRWLPITLAALAGIGVEPYEVLQVLHAQRRLPVPCTVGQVPAIAICARTRAGRALVVAVRETSTLGHDIIAVRELTGQELAQFEQWEGEPYD